MKKKVPQGRRKRPYTTHYYDNNKAGVPTATSHGYSASEKGAIRAAVVRVFMGEHSYALVFEGSYLIYTIKLGNKGLQVDFRRIA